MIFPELIVKPDADGYRFISLSNESEALVDSAVFSRLVKISKIERQGLLNSQDISLLNELSSLIGLISEDGAGEIVIRHGEFSNLEIYLTNSCNLRCKHCYYFEPGKYCDEKHVELESLKRAIIDAESIGMYRIKLCGGEPLRYRYMNELIEFINSRKIGTTIISNGILLDKYLDYMDARKTSLVISVDGFESSHDYLRGNGNFSKTISNVTAAISRGFDVAVNMSVYDKNAGDIDAFDKYVQSIGVRLLNIQVVRPRGMAVEYLKDQMVYRDDFLREVHQNELEDQKIKINSNTSFCTSCRTGLTIDIDGSVVGCPFLENPTIGNIFNESICEIYNRAMRENQLNFVNIKPACLSCELFMDKCAGGCRARAQRVVGSIYACDYWIPFLLNHPKFSESPKKAWEYLLI